MHASKAPSPTRAPGPNSTGLRVPPPPRQAGSQWTRVVRTAAGCQVGLLCRDRAAADAAAFKAAHRLFPGPTRTPLQATAMLPGWLQRALRLAECGDPGPGRRWGWRGTRPPGVGGAVQPASSLFFPASPPPKKRPPPPPRGWIKRCPARNRAARRPALAQTSGWRLHGRCTLPPPHALASSCWG